MRSGLAHLSLLGGGAASLSINENADPTVRTDMLAAMEHLVPSSLPGTDVAAVRSATFGNSVSIPVVNGRLSLGTWQGVYLCVWTSQPNFQIVATVQELASGSTATIVCTAPERGCHVIQEQVERALGKGLNGLCHVALRHTSAAIALGPREKHAGAQMETALNHLVPNRWNDEFFEHTYEGPDDMPGHVKSSLTGVTFSLPCQGGKLRSGPDQALYLCEHRDVGGYGGGHRRNVAVTSIPVGAHRQSSHMVPTPQPDECIQVRQEELLQALPEILQCKMGVLHIYLPSSGFALSMASSTSAVCRARDLLAVVKAAGTPTLAQPHALDLLGGPPCMELHVRDGRLVISAGYGLFVLNPRSNDEANIQQKKTGPQTETQTKPPGEPQADPQASPQTKHTDAKVRRTPRRADLALFLTLLGPETADTSSSKDV